MIRREYPREEEQTVKDLQAEITSLSADRDSLDQNIQDLTKEISDYEADVPHANSACSAHPSEVRNLSCAVPGVLYVLSFSFLFHFRRGWLAEHR